MSDLYLMFILLAVTSFAIPLLFSVIFLLFRLSSRFGYSFKTLTAPLISCGVSLLFAIFWSSPAVSLIQGDIGIISIWSVTGLVLMIALFWLIDSAHTRKQRKQRVASRQSDNGLRQFIKITSRVIFALILIPVSLITLFVIWTLITSPVFDHFDQERFTKLNTSMRSIYDSLQATSKSSEKWNYSKSCEEERNGDWPTGRYDCTIKIATEKQITSVQELNALQSKYYSVVNNNKKLTPIDDLQLESPEDFGKKFVVSAAERNYQEKDSGIRCNYSIQLLQKYTNSSFMQDYPSNQIQGSNGYLLISILCSEKARQNWYDISQ